MRRIVLLLSTVFFTMNLLSGQTADIQEGCLPLEVNFTGPDGLASYVWDFDGPGGSDLQNPEALFTTPGTFEVTLRETQGGPVIETLIITVFEEPDLAISANENFGCPPFLAEFTDASTIDPNITITSYSWGFGDGESDITTVPSTSHNYRNLGTFDVSLLIESPLPNCSRIEPFSDFIQIVTPPSPSFTTTPASLIACEPPLNVSFNNTSTGSGNFNLNHSWNFGNGNTSDALNGSPQVYENEGVSTISLTVSYDFGCPVTTRAGVSIGSPVAEINVEEGACTDESITISTPVSGGRYSWVLDGQLVSTAQSFFTTFDSPGDRTIELTLTSADGLCSDVATETFSVSDLNISASADPDFVCVNPTDVNYTATADDVNAAFNWNIGGSTFTGSNVTNAVVIDSDNDEFGVNRREVIPTTLVVTTPSGCRRDTSFFVTVAPPNALFDRDVVDGCAPLSVEFTDRSTSDVGEITNWNWDFGDGTTLNATDGNNVSHVYQEDGIYFATLSIINDLGCTDVSFEREIRVGDSTSIVPTFTVEPSVSCWDEVVTIENTTVTNLDYEFEFFIDNTNGAPIPQMLTFPVIRDVHDVVIEIDYNGCEFEVLQEDQINILGARAGASVTFDCADPFTYNFTEAGSLDAETFEWTLDGNTITTETFFDSTFAQTGDHSYILFVNNSEGCNPHFEGGNIFVRDIIADFSIDDSLICFNDPDGNVFDGGSSQDVAPGTTYEWTFSGRAPFSAMSPATNFSFSTPGLNIATLEVRAQNGCTDTFTREFQVFQVRPGFNSEDELCLPATLNFAEIVDPNPDTTLVRWEWDFGDGSNPLVWNPSSDRSPFERDFTNAPANNLNYVVGLTITDVLDCRQSANVVIDFYRPSSVISISDRQICTGESVDILGSDFTAQGSNLSFDWDFGNGETGTGNINTVQYNDAGVFTVMLDVEENASSCPGQAASMTIEVQDIPVAGFRSDLDDVDLICLQDAFAFFTDTSQGSIVSRRWTFDNGVSEPQVLTIENPQFTFPEIGDWTVELMTTTSFGCVDMTQNDYEVRGPRGDFDISSNDPICRGDSLVFTLRDTADVASFSWNFGDGVGLENVNPATNTFTFHPEGGILPVALLLRSDEDCEAFIVKPVEIINVIAEFSVNDGLDTAQCLEAGAFILRDSSVNADNYVWDLGDGSPQILEQRDSILHTYAEPGTYTITLNVTNNTIPCPDVFTQDVVVFDVPTINPINDTNCLTTPVTVAQLSADSSPENGSMYVWSPGELLSDSTIVNPTTDVTETTTFSFLKTDVNGCTARGEATAFVIAEPDFTDFDTTIVIGDFVTLPFDESEIRIFEWNPEEGLSCLQCNNPVIQPLEDIVYELTVTDVLGCFSATNFFADITVRPETFIRIPSTFTPNGDGANDRVFVEGWGIRELLSFDIYNRWGELLYSSNDITEGWDGEHQGVLQNDDAYVYRVRALSWREEILDLEGYIQLAH